MSDNHRVPVETKADLDTLNEDEILEGYLDGYGGELQCGDNRSRSYWHGWRNGHNDRNHKVDTAQRLLIRDLGIGKKARSDA